MSEAKRLIRAITEGTCECGSGYEPFEDSCPTCGLVKGKKQNPDDVKSMDAAIDNKAPDPYRSTDAEFGGLNFGGDVYEDFESENRAAASKTIDSMVDAGRDLASDLLPGGFDKDGDHPPDLELPESRGSMAAQLLEELEGGDFDADDTSNNYEEDDEVTESPSTTVQESEWSKYDLCTTCKHRHPRANEVPHINYYDYGPGGPMDEPAEEECRTCGRVHPHANETPHVNYYDRGPGGNG